MLKKRNKNNKITIKKDQYCEVDFKLTLKQFQSFLYNIGVMDIKSNIDTNKFRYNGGSLNAASSNLLYHNIKKLERTLKNNKSLEFKLYCKIVNEEGGMYILRFIHIVSYSTDPLIARFLYQYKTTRFFKQLFISIIKYNLTRNTIYSNNHFVIDETFSFYCSKDKVNIIKDNYKVDSIDISREELSKIVYLLGKEQLLTYQELGEKLNKLL